MALADWADVDALDLIGEDRDEEEREPGSDFDEIPRFMIAAMLTGFTAHGAVIFGCLVSPAEDYEGAPPFCVSVNVRSVWLQTYSLPIVTLWRVAVFVKTLSYPPARE